MPESHFIKYPHVERFGVTETEGIECGECYVFPKLDGTNASAWIDAEGTLHLGSRNRCLTLSGVDDNAGFREHVYSTELFDQLKDFFSDYPHLRLYGEWLVPHTLKAYRDEAWRRFWIFDVLNENARWFEPYDYYTYLLDEYGLDYIEPLCVIKKPTHENLLQVAKSNTYLLRDGEGPGEGVVVKRYDWCNPYGRQSWAKVVLNDFKEQSRRAMGVPKKEGSFVLECAIAEEFCTKALVEKTRAKVERQMLLEFEGSDKEAGAFVRSAEARKQLIPRLLQTVFYELVREEAWNFVKKHKNPTIDFKRLQKYVNEETKRHASDLF